MGKMTYQEQLQDTRWFRKREGILKRDNFRCQDCLRRDLELHVHHKEYIDGRMAWDYPDELLITLCESCHKRFHTGDTRLERERPWRLYDVDTTSHPVIKIDAMVYVWACEYYRKLRANG